MHPLINVNLQDLSDKELQEKIGTFLSKMAFCGRTGNMPLYNQINMVYQMYCNEARERADRNQRALEEVMREKQGLPREEPPAKNLTLD